MISYESILTATFTQPDLSSLSCDSANANLSTCLTAAKIKTMYALWSPWTSTNGELLFPGFEPGTESLSEFALANPGINFGERWLRVVATLHL